MSAETLGRAAALMRERAEDSVPGPWDSTRGNQVVAGYGSPADGEQVADCFDNVSTSLHIASWHPDVALAVALLLENESHAWDSQDAADPEGDRPWLVNYARRDLLTSIAQTYLGEPS